MKISLRTKLILSYTLLSLFLIASLFFIGNYHIEKQFHYYLDEKREQFNQELVEDLNEILSNGTLSPSDFRMIMDRAMRNNAYLFLESSNGEDLLKQLRYNKNSKEDKDDRERDRKQGKNWQSTLNRWQQNGVEVVKKSYPLYVNNQYIGNAVLSYPGDMGNADDYFIQILNSFLGRVALISLLIAIGCGYYIANIISSPLRQVITQTDNIAQGDYQKRLAVQSNTTEISELISCVNNLASTLEKQQQMQKRLARDYAHEVRTPLAAIQSNLEGMIDGVLPTTNERLESCRVEILRLTRMIADIDKIIEISESSIILELETFNLSELVQLVLQTFDKQILDRKINLTTELDAVAVHLDKDKIGQVLVNLLSNAIKFNDENGLLDIKVFQEQNQAIISIADNGCGISTQDLPHIFEHLYRADQSRNRATGGSGIGLAIVKGIIEAHQGSITVESKLNQGTIFTVKLPIK